MVVTVLVNELDAWLQAQPENTPDTAYEVKIVENNENIEISSQSLQKIRTALKNNNKKYVNLQNTIILSTVWNMGAVFLDCTSLVKSPDIPESAQDMRYTFSGCSSLIKAPIIPNLVKNMSYTFSGCTSLIEAPEIPESVTIMSYAFNGCTSLIEASEIPESVIDMSSTFSGCTSLTEASEIPESVSDMSYTFYGCSSLIEAPEIPNSVTSLETTFKGCISLTKAPKIPSSVTSLRFTFSGCTSLIKAPEIPNSVTNMEETFRECTSLIEAPEIPESVSDMSNTFRECESLKCVPNIPKSVKNLSYTFFYCVNLKIIKYFNVDINNITNYTYLFGNDSNLMVYCNPNVTQGWKTKASTTGSGIGISESHFINAWDYNSESDIYNLIKDTVYSLYSALDDNTVSNPYKLNIIDTLSSDCSSKTDISILGDVIKSDTKYIDLSPLTLPSTTSIQNCFNGCTNLVGTPKIPNSVTNMDSALKGCTNLKTVQNIPSSIKNLESTFSGCSSLETIEDWKAGTDVTIDENTFAGCTSLQNIYVDRPEPKDNNTWAFYTITPNPTTGKAIISIYKKTDSATRASSKIDVEIDYTDYSILTLNGYTDELVLAPEENLTEEVIQKFMDNPYPFTDNPQVLDPDKRNFVLWASDPESFKSNMFQAFQSDWNETDAQQSGYIRNKPDIEQMITDGTKDKLDKNGTAKAAEKLTDLGDVDKASSTSTKRKVWFSYNDGVTGRPAIDDNLSYQTDIGELRSKRFKVNDKVSLVWNSTTNSLDFTFN